VTYGGGISELKDVEKLITECGVDKVAIKTNHKIIPQIAEKFGSQAIVGVIDYKIGVHSKSYLGLMYLLYGFQNAGAGEILLTSIYNNGLQKGYDVYALKFTGQINIPIIINGGCADPSHMIEAIQNGADAVAASTMFLLTEHTPKDCARALDAAGAAVRVDG
jgi:cyclase